MTELEVIVNLWNQFLGLMSSFTLLSALDVLLVSFIIYSFIKLIRETRAEQLVKGILILVVVWALSNLLGLQMMKNVMSYVFNLSVIALLIVFQPEVRRALEQMGRSGISKGLGLVQKEEEMDQQRKKGIQAVVEAAVSFQRSKTGALIVFERETKLGDIVNTGTIVAAEPSAPLIGNIFFNKAPLHDGAMIIRDGMIYAAGCILPLTKSDRVSIELGTRHRAGIGMSENSDAVVVIVSEETGQISIAVGGELSRNYTRETLEKALEQYLLAGEKPERRIPSIWRIKSNEEKQRNK